MSNLLPIIPQPKKVILDGGEENYKVYCTPAVITSAPEFSRFLPTFKLNATKLHGLLLTDGEGGISLKTDTSLEGEAYRIECCEDGINLYASTDDGIVNALSTIHQIINEKDGRISYPAYYIEDRPDSSYRALMIFMPYHMNRFEDILHYIDVCYLNKIKFIHINGCYPSKKFPKFNESGKKFTWEQIDKLNEYCKERNVEIIPAIQVPGHTEYLNILYPELFDHTPISGHVRRDIICIGKPGVLDSLRELITEVMEMFPNSRYFHIGGDEAEISAWNNCVDCRRYMEENGINGVKELYSHAVKLITDIVLDLGKTPVVWEGFPKEGSEGISRKVIVTAWESLYHLPTDLIEEGFTITNSSWMPLYIVRPEHHGVKGGRWYPKDIINDWNVYTWKNWWEKSCAYEKPIVVEPTDQVLGGTYCAWSTTYEQDINTIIENLPAVSEKLWNVASTLTIDEFNRSLPNITTLADKIK